MRSYDEYCALAKTLDVVGDRWTLLIVRELALKGPCRYTDVRHGLPGIATNLLADRLRELERAGVVKREEAPPPIATTVFSLTERGDQLRPVLESLVRWGLPLMVDQRPEDAVQSHWLVWALEQILTDNEPGRPAVRIELRLGDQPIGIEARDGRIHATVGPLDEPDVVLTGEARPILGLLIGAHDVQGARAAGVDVHGDAGALDRVRGAGLAMPAAASA